MPLSKMYFHLGIELYWGKVVPIVSATLCTPAIWQVSFWVILLSLPSVWPQECWGSRCPPLHLAFWGFSGLNSCHKPCMANAFTCWTSSLARKHSSLTNGSEFGGLDIHFCIIILISSRNRLTTVLKQQCESNSIPLLRCSFMWRPFPWWCLLSKANLC